MEILEAEGSALLFPELGDLFVGVHRYKRRRRWALFSFGLPATYQIDNRESTAYR